MCSCYFFKSDTTGEKEIEEFYVAEDKVNLNLYDSIGVIKSGLNTKHQQLDTFYKQVSEMVLEGTASKSDIIHLFETILPEFQHKETGKYLDQKM